MSKKKLADKLSKEIGSACLTAAKKGLPAELLMATQIGCLYGVMQNLRMPPDVIAGHLRRLADEVEA
jgi:hypothetical protein